MKKSNKVILVAVIIIIIATLTSLVGVIFVQKNKPQVPDEITDVKEIEAPKEDYIRVLACGVDKSQKLTDVIMYAIYDIKNQKIDVLQIPRDSFVGQDYLTGKINGVYGSKRDHKEGMEELKKILKEQLKLDVDYTATITLEGVSNIVDSLGGVKMNIPMTINYLPGKVINEGEQTIDGEKAEWLVRFRKGYKNADLGRLNMQKEFLMAMLDTVRDKGRISAVKAIASNFGELETDMPVTKAISIGNKAFGIENEDINMYTLEGRGKMYATYAVYEINKEKAAELLNEHFRLGEKVSAEDLGVKEVPYIEVPKKEQLTDELGRPIDEYGFLIDEDGNPIDENGNYIIFKDDDGIICDKFGTPVEVDENGYPIYNNSTKNKDIPQENQQIVGGIDEVIGYDDGETSEGGEQFDNYKDEETSSTVDESEIYE